jgi:alpha-glucosidase (family GH31 glycosyl hydrolase)
MLMLLSGRAPMPNIQSLGFHFSKWDNITSNILIERNYNFTKFGFPVDYLWMDIAYAD